MPEVELVGLARLNRGGKLFIKGVREPVDFETALALKDNPRFKVYGLDTREALAYQETQTRPRGADLYDAINEAIDALEPDDENYDRSGKAAVGVLSSALGYPVTKEERDAAMASIRKTPQAGGAPIPADARAEPEPVPAEPKPVKLKLKHVDPVAEEKVPV